VIIVRRFRGATRIKALIHSKGRPAASRGEGLVFYSDIREPDVGVGALKKTAGVRRCGLMVVPSPVGMPDNDG
jgi:hypothetical protein